MLKSFTTTQLIAKEGWVIIGVVFVLLLISYFIDFAFWILLFGFFLSLYIFRNPERIANEDDPLAIISPADGRITSIDRKSSLKTNKAYLYVQIRSLPLDVGIVRFPINAVLKNITTVHGLFLPVFKKNADILNERATIQCLHEEKPFIMKLRCGVFNRKIDLTKTRGVLKAGTRVAFMNEGVVELFLPVDSRIKLSVGDYVKSGESVIGYLAFGVKK